MAIYQSMYKGAQMDAADTLSLNPDATPTENSTNLATSGGVFSAIGSAQNASAPAILNTASGAVCSFADGSASPMTSVIAEIVASQAGSGDPAPDNIRPITGYTGANVTRAGRNMLNPKKAKSGSNIQLGVDVFGANTPSIILPAGTYTWSLTLANNLARNMYCSDLDTGAYVSGFPSYQPAASTPAVKTFTLDKRTRIRLWTYNPDITSIDDVVSSQLEAGSTAHDYEAYNGEVFSVSWADEAGTVYEGDAQIIGASGEGRKADYFYTFDGTENWSYQSSSQIFTFGMAVQSNGRWQDILCSHFPAKNIYSGTTNEGVGCWNAQFYLRWPSMFTDVATLKAFLAAQYAAGTPVQIKLVRATPETFSFNGVQIDSFHGDNSLWNNVGGDTSAEYRADTKLYIQSLLGA